MDTLPATGLYWCATTGYKDEIHTYTVQVRADGTSKSSGIVWTETFTRHMQAADRLHATEAEAVRVLRQYTALVKV